MPVLSINFAKPSSEKFYKMAAEISAAETRFAPLERERALHKMAAEPFSFQSFKKSKANSF